MKVLDAIKKVFDKILEVLGIICLAIMTIMIVYQVRIFLEKDPPKKINCQI